MPSYSILILYLSFTFRLYEICGHIHTARISSGMELS